MDPEERLMEILRGNSRRVYTLENTIGKITIEINFSNQASAKVFYFNVSTWNINIFQSKYFSVLTFQTALKRFQAEASGWRAFVHISSSTKVLEWLKAADGSRSLYKKGQKLCCGARQNKQRDVNLSCWLSFSLTASLQTIWIMN